MYATLFVASLLVLLCIFFSSRVLYRFGVPSLLVFLLLGMLLGSDGLGGIYFSNFELAENISTFAIVIIIFFGGFGTKWTTAKPVVLKAALMSSAGTVVTALVIGFFAHLVLNVPFRYGLLFGSVVGSTDAASVFSILRSRKLGLKGGLAPLLEIESGSNDPFAYMMTILVIAAIQARGGGFGQTVGTLVIQLGVGAAVGAIASVLAVVVLNRLQLQISGLNPILLFAMVILTFSLCMLLGGNGLLCVYILGISIGNSKILHKTSLVHFFDGLSWIMQILLFFVLGLLAYPSRLPSVMIQGFLLSALLIFVARPIAAFGLLTWFKMPVKQIIFIAWVGLRGSASIVFAIIAVTAVRDELPFDLFHIVFFIALFSILTQGTLTPYMAKFLDVADDDESNSVMKTFTDYLEESHTQLYEYKITAKDKFAGKEIVDSDFPDDILIIAVRRKHEVIVPKGSTKLEAGDILMVTGESFTFFESM